MNTTTATGFYEGDDTMEAPFIVSDINASLERLMNEKGWEETDCNGITLFKTDHITTVMICMPSGAEIGENAIDGTVTVQVVEGKLQLTADGEASHLSTGQIAMLPHHVTHSMVAEEETVVLLTNYTC